MKNVEIVFIGKNKKEIPVNGNISPVMENGEFIRTIGIFRDKTLNEESEAKLKNAEERYRVIFENSAAAIMFVDSKQRIVSWNKFAEKLLGRNKNDLFQKPVSSLYPPKEWDKIRSLDIIKKGLQHHLETKILKKNNVPLDIDISISVLRNKDNEVIGSVGIIRDISERKNAERKIEENSKILTELNKKAISALEESKEKNNELQKFQNFSVGRELKMVELKNKIKKLEKELSNKKSA